MKQERFFWPTIAGASLTIALVLMGQTLAAACADFAALVCYACWASGSCG